MLTDFNSLKKFPFTLSNKESLPECSNEICQMNAVVYCTKAKKLFCVKCLNIYHSQNNKEYVGACGIRFLCLCPRDLNIYKICFKCGGNCNKEIGNRRVTLTQDHFLFNPTIESVKLFEKHGANFSSTHPRHGNVLNYYCSSANVDPEVLEYLLSLGVSPSVSNSRNQNPFQLYSAQPNAKISVLKLFSKQLESELNKTNNQNETIIFGAVRGNDKPNYSVMKFLIDRGLDLEVRNMKQQTALHLLCQKTDPEYEAIKLLVDHSKTILMADSEGKTAFHYYLIKNSDLRIIELFLANGETLHGHKNAQKQTALHYLFLQQDVTIEKIQFYLNPKHNLDIDQKDIDDFTPIHLRCSLEKIVNPKQTLEVLKYLKKSCGANFHQINSYNETYLMSYCRYHNDPEIIEFLLKHSKDVNHDDNDYANTALHYILCPSNPKILYKLCSLFFKYGADPNQPNDGKNTPFHVLMIIKATFKLIKLFLDNGADSHLKNVCISNLGIIYLSFYFYFKMYRYLY
ncbi:ankyrin repeat-containing protein [Anaeramoeba flamelloides]|uniref:Ankyrin repeat-containing protein n=1 Tax=Anaeramoeba flamelloides TaxID=1746091 RepID=A0ABQ8XDV1_9EUKA|nr:ankyrin repeat-containing protein [Anaeramoeba flamelloides]